MLDVLASPLVGICIGLGTYWVGLQVKKYTSSPLLNPLIIATALTILLIQLTPLTLDQYQVGGNFIIAFMTPAMATLAMQMYKYKQVLQTNFWPIVIGCLAGSIMAMGSVYLLCYLLIDDLRLMISLLPKSVTSPVALSLAELYGGIGAIAMAGVLFTGIFSAVLTPFLIKLCRLKDPVAIGAAFGTSGHVLGTTKAIEMGPVEGAISGIAIGITGLWTSILFLVLFSG